MPLVCETLRHVDYLGWRGARARPGLEALQEQRSHFSAVIVPKLSRFGRSVSELVRLFDLFDPEGISLVLRR
jgi:DNA invertase Pin-like site-specific DNA recombinase